MARPSPNASGSDEGRTGATRPVIIAPGAPPPQQAPAAPGEPDDRQTEAYRMERRSASPPPGDSGSGIAVNRVVTPVLVEVLPTEARAPRQGGSAVVLLANPGAALNEEKNLALCQALFRALDQATTREVAVGSRRTTEGETQLLRPLYWLTRSVMQERAGADRCPTRLDSYDYQRADTIRRKLALSGSGPYLVVERHDNFTNERTAAVIDLSRARASEIPAIVAYFRTGFMQAGDVWDAQRFQREQTSPNLIAGVNNALARGIVPRLIRTTRQVGCAFTDLLDGCSI